MSIVDTFQYANEVKEYTYQNTYDYVNLYLGMDAFSGNCQFTVSAVNSRGISFVLTGKNGVSTPFTVIGGSSNQVNKAYLPAKTITTIMVECESSYIEPQHNYVLRAKSYISDK